MIGRLSGTVFGFEDHALVDVGGVGYLVYCSAKALHNFKNGEYYQLFIETHVREDHIHLYGFLSILERQVFNLLKSVNGIGPRMALAILSHLEPHQIQNAITSQNKEAFRIVAGVGGKLAERIIIELKDKMLSGAAVYSYNTGKSNIAADAVSALANLGINKMEAQTMVSNILAVQEEISIDELIKLALKARR